eukprot:scaffold1157_cov36-Tisochrysis_lutea.AAC.1
MSARPRRTCGAPGRAWGRTTRKRFRARAKSTRRPQKSTRGRAVRRAPARSPGTFTPGRQYRALRGRTASPAPSTSALLASAASRLARMQCAAGREPPK